jgi:hypothetical protein
MIKLAQGVLAAIGAILAASAAAGLGLGSPARTGGETGREDFEQLTIHYKTPSVYLAPKG